MEEAAGHGPKVLTPRDASGAILLRDDGRYLMQLRDDKPGIFFPAHWGMFGGAIDGGETAEAALRRELHEELAIEVDAIDYFTTLTADFAPHGYGIIARYFYEILLSPAQLGSLRLGEGSAMRWFDGDVLLRTELVTPYDAFAIWMHRTRATAA